MDVLAFVLDGLEKELELERELGVRTIEIDRALLTPLSASVAVPPSAPAPRPPAVPPAARPAAVRPAVAASPVAHVGSAFDFVFLHDQPLSPAATGMMAKIVAAMGKDAATAPVVTELPVPSAKVQVVLGARALRKFLPGKRGEPGMWVKTADGRDALVTYSPEFFLRFATVTPGVQKMKQDMWRSLKAVMQRVRSMA